MFIYPPPPPPRVFYLLICLLIAQASVAQQTVKMFKGRQHILMNGHWHFYNPSTEEWIRMEDSIISVRFTESATHAEINTFEVTYHLQRIRYNRLRIYDYAVCKDSVFERITALSNSPILLDADLNYYLQVADFQLPPPNDPNYQNGNSWHIPQIEGTSMWNYVYTYSPNCTPIVAVIDGDINYAHEDIGMGNDAYENVYYNPGEDMWSNTNNPATGNQQDDDDTDNNPTTFMDDLKGWDFLGNDNDIRSNNTGIPSTNNADHGTAVAGVLLAKTNNAVGISGVAGGYGNQGAKLLGLRVLTDEWVTSSVIDDAILYAADMQAKIINMSFFTTLNMTNIELALKEAHDKGCILVAGAGNENKLNGTYATRFPAKSKYVLSVGNSKQDDYIYNGIPTWTGDPSCVTQDVMAPGTEIISTSTGSNGQSNYVKRTGTSYAAPVVSGIASNMSCLNPCLTTEWVRDILRITSDKVPNTIYYNQAPDYPIGFNPIYGYGRVNGFKAVQAAKKAYSANLDLYIKDCLDDIGTTGADYACTSGTDKSPDIWIREFQDGIQADGTIQDEHQEVMYKTTPVYVYVRVRNKSCVASQGNELLHVYWSKAATWGSWPQNWDGSNPSIGNSVASITLPIIQPGETKVIEVPWTMDPGLAPLPNVFYNYCILARIESALDPIVPFGPANMVEINNNIALRNTITWKYNQMSPVGYTLSDGVNYPSGSFIAVENALEETSSFDLVFEVPALHNGNIITHDAEIVFVPSEELYEALTTANCLHQQGVTVLSNGEIIIRANPVVFSNVHIPATTRWENFVGIRFYADSMHTGKRYAYFVGQRFHDSTDWLGGENITIDMQPRTTFHADAGPDYSIFLGDSVTVCATQLPESVHYQWYNQLTGNIEDSIRCFVAKPTQATSYRLRVTSDDDGSVMYDDMQIAIKHGHIVSLYPNPVSHWLHVQYELEHIQQAQFILVSPFMNQWHSYTIPTTEMQYDIDMSSFPIGVYSLLLVADGKLLQSESLLKY